MFSSSCVTSLRGGHASLLTAMQENTFVSVVYYCTLCFRMGPLSYLYFCPRFLFYLLVLSAHPLPLRRARRSASHPTDSLTWWRPSASSGSSPWYVNRSVCGHTHARRTPHTRTPHAAHTHAAHAHTRTHTHTHTCRHRKSVSRLWERRACNVWCATASSSLEISRCVVRSPSLSPSANPHALLLPLGTISGGIFRGREYAATHAERLGVRFGSALPRARGTVPRPLVERAARRVSRHHLAHAAGGNDGGTHPGTRTRTHPSLGRPHVLSSASSLLCAMVLERASFWY